MRRNGGESFIGEARSLRPDASIQNSDDDVIGVVGVGPQAESISEAQKLGGPGGVEVANCVGDDGDYAWNAAEDIGLSGGKTGGESAHGAVIGVENLGRAVVRREGSYDAGVPVVVGGEGEGLLRFGDVDDEGLLAVG